jgi:hypothetical protein
LWVEKTNLFLNLELENTVRLPLIAGEKTHSWGKFTVEETNILWVKTTNVYLYLILGKKVRLLLFFGEKTHSWGKIKVQKTSILKVKKSFAFPIWQKNMG